MVIKRVSLQSEIIEFIKNYVEEKNLRSGDKLPSQNELIEMLGVSRTSLREAIKTLEAKNFLQVVNGKGIFLKNASSDILYTQIEFKKEKESILELLEVRRILEREIMSLVIKNATEEELDKIEKILNIVMEKYNKGEKQNKEDKEFHLAIYKFCHNKIMYQLILSIEDMLSKLWDFPLGLEDPFIDTIPLHRDLFNCIRKRDVKKAQAVNDKILHMMCDEVKNAELR